MKTFAEFLVDFLIDKNDFDEKNWPEYRQDYINDYNKAIDAYKKHLQDDSPKTMGAVMLEKDLIIALERMQNFNTHEKNKR